MDLGRGGGQLVLRLEMRRIVDPPPCGDELDMEPTEVAVRRLRSETYPQSVQLFLDLDEAVAMQRLRASASVPQGGAGRTQELPSLALPASPRTMDNEVRAISRPQSEDESFCEGCHGLGVNVCAGIDN